MRGKRQQSSGWDGDEGDSTYGTYGDLWLLWHLQRTPGYGYDDYDDQYADQRVG